MPSRLEVLLEAERRGKLTPEMAGILSEARKRGLIDPAPEGGVSVSAPEKAAMTATDLPQKPQAGGAARMAEFGARGFMDSAMETVGAIPELVASGLRYTGLPAPKPGYYADTLKKGYRKVGQALSAPISSAVDFGPDAPADVAEKAAYGGGRGVADVATFMAPGAALAKYTKGVPQAVGKAMTASPGIQATAGATAGAVTEATGDDKLGLAAGLAVPALALVGKKVVTPVGLQLSGEEARLAKLAEQYGIKLTAGQATGSKPLAAVESSFTQLPLTGGKQAAIYDGQRSAFNKAVLNTAGINADTATPAVLDNAFTTLGQRFEQLAAQTQVKVDAKLANDIQSVIADQGRKLTNDVSPVFRAYADDFMQMVNAARKSGITSVYLDGRQYQNVASSIRKAARRAGQNYDLKDALGKLADKIDDAMGRSMSGKLTGPWKEVRNQYRNLKMIDDAMRMAPQADAVSGNIPFGAFSNAVKASDKTGFARGRGKLNDLSRIGQFLGSMKIPDSGTPIRSNAISMLQGGPLAVGGTTALTTNSLPMAAGSAALTYGLPPIVQGIMNSKPGQAYLRNNLMPANLPPGLLRNIAAANQMGQIKR